MKDEDKTKKQLLEELTALRQRIAQLEAAENRRKQAEKTLREMETTLYRLKKAVETTGVGITITDNDGKILYTNPADAKMHGYTIDELIGRPSNIFTTPEHREGRKRQRDDQEIFYNWERERTNMRKDGSVFPSKLTSNPIYDTQKFHIGTVTVCEDITERKRSEKAIRKSLKLLEKIFASLEEVVFVIDPATRTIILCNPIVEHIFGYRDQELFGQPIKCLFGDQTIYDHFEEDLFSALDAKDVFHAECQMRRKDGNVVISEHTATEIVDDSGHRTAVVNVVRDITERKRTEEALRREHDLASALAETAEALITTLDFEQVLDCILDQVSHVVPNDTADIMIIEGDQARIVRCRGYERFGMEEWISTLVVRISEIYNLQYMLNSREPRLVPDVATDADWVDVPGQEWLRSYAAVPIIIRDEVIGFLNVTNAVSGFFTQTHVEALRALARHAAAAIENARLYEVARQELSERNRAEKALRQAKEAAEAANQAKSVFLANMSHELRTPLNAILGFAQIMASDPHTPEEEENLSIIQRSGEHLLTLINQVLDLSKVEAGHITFNAIDFDLYSLLDDLEDMFRLRTEKKGLYLLFERTADVPQYVRTDEVKLRQVLINLLNNAMKFTKEGGVAVRVKELMIDDWRLAIEKTPRQSRIKNQQSTIRFEIEDTGPGIAPEEIDKLFEAFTQTESGRQAQEGTGLGLPISRKFVQLMGGDITVKSEVGHGTTFRFDIRFDVVEETSIAGKRPTRRVIALESGQPRYRILIVDDKPDNRKLLVKLLNPFGFALREAHNGQEAIEIWSQWKPHLIWIDIRMPVMDGYEATKKIREAEKQKLRRAEDRREKAATESETLQSTIRTVIIAVTASSFEEEQAVALSVGCDDFLRKPLRKADVFDLLHKHLGVRFVYEEEQQAAGSRQQVARQEVLTPEALAGLPAELVTRLHHAVEALDVDTAKHIIEQIRQQNAPLAEALEELVKEYRFDTLQGLFEEIQ